MNLPEHSATGNCAVDTTLFGDNQAILSKSENGLQMAVHSLSQICKDFGIQMSTLMSKVMEFHGANPVQA